MGVHTEVGSMQFHLTNEKKKLKVNIITRLKDIETYQPLPHLEETLLAVAVSFYLRLFTFFV